MVVCLERDADLHTAQLMPMPLTVSCFSKIQIGFTFLLLAHPGSPGQRAVKLVCVCVRRDFCGLTICCDRKMCTWFSTLSVLIYCGKFAILLAYCQYVLCFCRDNMPSHFKFKEYCPVVFRNLRERFGIDEEVYLVCSSGLIFPSCQPCKVKVAHT